MCVLQGLAMLGTKVGLREFIGSPLPALEAAPAPA